MSTSAKPKPKAKAKTKAKPGVVVTSARLPYETRAKLSGLAINKKMTKTQVIIAALDAYYEQEKEPQLDSYTLGLPYFGKYSSGETDLSTTYKERLKIKLREKHLAQSGSR